MQERLAETAAANNALLAAALRAEEAAETATSVQRQLEALITGLAEGIIVLDGAGRILLVNPAARRILNLWQPAEGDHWVSSSQSYQRLDGAQVSAEEKPVLSAIRGERYTDRELLVITGESKPRRCLFSANSVLDGSGRVAMAIVTVRDVTELRDLEHLRDQYLSLISHDLRGPLALVLGAADRLSRSRQESGDAETAELISMIRDGGERMNAMISQLMRVASLESGQVALEREPIALPRLAAAVVEQCLPRGEARPVTVESGEDVPPVMGDTDLIEHALTNLVTNAMKYSDPETLIAVRIERSADDVVVSVRDHGRGIPPETLPFVFDRFYRVKDEKAPRSGYGLGLYIVRLIVEAHGGRIWADSQPGIGSTFTFTLPVGDLED